jgi:hypothetical protein
MTDDGKPTTIVVRSGSHNATAQQYTATNTASARELKTLAGARATSAEPTRRPTRLKQDRITIQNATVYHLVAEPLRIERKILAHAPVNLSSLSHAPIEMARTASILQEVCDTAFVHYAQLFPGDSGDVGDAVAYLEQMSETPYYAWTTPEGRAVWSDQKTDAVRHGAAIGGAHGVAAEGQGPRRDFVEAKRSHPDRSPATTLGGDIEKPTIPIIMVQQSGVLPQEPREVTHVISEHGESVTQLDTASDDSVFALTLTKHNIADAMRKCEEFGTTLPDVVTAKDIHMLKNFLLRNQKHGVIGTFLNIMHDDLLGRNMNRAGEVASRISSAHWVDSAYCLAKKESLYFWEQSNECGLATKYDDTRSIAYVMYADGYIYTVRQPLYHTGTDFETLAANYGMTETEVIEKAPQFLKLPVICQKSPSQRVSGIFLNQTNSPDANFQQTYKETIQLCYDTVDSIEAESAQAQVRLVDFIDSHGLIRSEDIPLRGKRSLMGAFSLMQAAIKGFESTRRFMTPITKLLSRRLFKSVMPSKRKAFSLLAEQKVSGRVLAPLAVGAAGLGFGLWQNYRTKRTLQQQRQMIMRHQERLNVYSREIGTVALTAERNAQTIVELRTEMRELGDIIIRVRAGSTLLAATAKIHTGLARAQQRQIVQLNTFEVRMRELAEILVQGNDDRIPQLLTPQLRSIEALRTIPEDSLLPDPDGPVEVIPIIKGDILHIYLNFLTGREKWELYDIYPLPRFADERMYTRKVAFRHALVGNRLRRYIPINAVEADNCRKGACAGTGVQYRLSNDPCTITMLALKEPHVDCAVEDGPAAPYFKILDQYMVYSVPSPAVASLHCDNSNDLARPGVDKELRLNGIGLVEIPAGCNFQMNKPDISASGPPSIATLKLDTPESHQLGGSRIHTEKVVAGLSALKASKVLASKFQTNKSKLELFKWIAIGAIVTVTITLILLVLHTSWLYTRFRLVKTRLSVAIAGLNTAFQSSLMAASKVYRFLSDRPMLRQYLEGGQEGRPDLEPPLQRHILTADLRTADREQISLSALSPLDRDEPPATDGARSLRDVYNFSTLKRAVLKRTRFRKPVLTQTHTYTPTEYITDVAAPARSRSNEPAQSPIIRRDPTLCDQRRIRREQIDRRSDELSAIIQRATRRARRAPGDRQPEFPAIGMNAERPPTPTLPSYGADRSLDDTDVYPSEISDTETIRMASPTPALLRYEYPRPATPGPGAGSREIDTRAFTFRQQSRRREGSRTDSPPGSPSIGRAPRGDR